MGGAAAPAGGDDTPPDLGPGTPPDTGDAGDAGGDAAAPTPTPTPGGETSALPT